MDDIMVKFRKGSDLLTDLAETFTNLRTFGIKLNPGKCTFGVPAFKLLSFLVTERGIDAKPEKIGAIVQMIQPECLHDVHRLIGCLAALSRFISRLGEKALPLYQLMKKQTNLNGGMKRKLRSRNSKLCFPPTDACHSE